MTSFKLYSALLASSEDVQSENTPLLNRARVRRLLYISIKGKRKDRDGRKRQNNITPSHCLRSVSETNAK